jgi:hypothetical protein
VTGGYVRNRENLAAGCGPTRPIIASVEQHSGIDLRQREWRAKTRAAMNPAASYAVHALLAGCALTAVALVLIDHYPDSGPALFAVQVAAVLAGPMLAVTGVFWLFRLARRRRAIRHRAWREVPARAAVLRAGPFRLTVVGLTLPSGKTWVVFPQRLGRSRIRRLVERDERLLVLMPRPGHLLDQPLFAGVSGSPVFVDQHPIATTAQSYWERRAKRALQSHPR